MVTLLRYAVRVRSQHALTPKATAMQIIELTHWVPGNAWENSDFSEATLLFSPGFDLPDDAAFRVWGVTIVSTHQYIAGAGTLRINTLEAGSIALWLYSAEGRELLHDSSGEAIRLAHTWGRPPISDAPEYRFESALAWPDGYVQLALRARGRVTFEYDPAWAIAMDAYTREPHRFGWRRTPAATEPS